MESPTNGELIPTGGGDPIPLIRPILTIGRRETCDICLRFPNISNYHCELFFENGLWFIVDPGSTNGVKVNGVRLSPRLRKALHPGDTIAIAKREYTIEYQSFGQNTLEEILETQEEVFDQPLLERAGLVRRTQDDEDLRPLTPEGRTVEGGLVPGYEFLQALPPKQPVKAEDADADDLDLSPAPAETLAPTEDLNADDLDLFPLPPEPPAGVEAADPDDLDLSPAPLEPPVGAAEANADDLDLSPVPAEPPAQAIEAAPADEDLSALSAELSPQPEEPVQEKKEE